MIKPRAAALLCLAILLAGCQGPADTKPTAGMAGFDTSPSNPAAVATARADNPRWVRWHERKVAIAKRGKTRVMFLGDSITEQWAFGGLGIWRETFYPLGSDNFGISADRTEHVLWRLDHGELDGIDPDVVVVMIGSNNLKSGAVRMSPDQTAGGVAAVVAKLRDRLPRATILLMSILPRQPHYSWIDQAVDQTNNQISRLAQAEKVEWIDISAKFRKTDGSLDPKYYRSDKLHLNQVGYRIWADAVEPAIRQALAGG